MDQIILLGVIFFPMVGPVRMAWNTLRLWKNRKEFIIEEKRLQSIRDHTRMYDEEEVEEREEIKAYRQKQSSLEQARMALVEGIMVEAGSHGVREAFLESYPQLVTQYLIICSTGTISIPQAISLPVSLLSLAIRSCIPSNS